MHTFLLLVQFVVILGLAAAGGHVADVPLWKIKEMYVYMYVSILILLLLLLLIYLK